MSSTANRSSGCRILVALVAALTLGAGAARGAEGPLAPGEGERRFLEHVRRLTFEGRRSGEAYFSPDGRRMVFQSEREPGNPFYQIYELSLETGDVRRISPGIGKTTCAFFQPGTGNILFASTHHDPRSAELQRKELELRASGRERRYAWDYDPQMELYLHVAATGELKRLTRANGYDAEGSFSPDGEWIVFSSNREAYLRALSDEERASLERDPSPFLEIYKMRADGTDVERLTRAPGYDGGPFFTPDGTRIVWRRFDESGVIADLWSMNADGTDPRQITDFGSMSWAPYTYPTGEYILFTSNKLGFDNFELFLVDAEGTREPVRVTYTPGFDGLPVPSPDGRRLAWTSNRDGVSSQVYLADWNHEHALAALRRSPARAFAGSSRSGDQEIGERLRKIGAEPIPGRRGFEVSIDCSDGEGTDSAGAARSLAAYLPARPGPDAGGARTGVVVLGTLLGERGLESRGEKVLLAAAEKLAMTGSARPVLLVFWPRPEPDCPDVTALVGEIGVPLERIVAYVDVRMTEEAGERQLRLSGVAGSSAWPALIERTNVVHGFDIVTSPAQDPGGFAESFDRSDVPSLGIRVGPQEGEGSGDVSGFVALLTRKIASMETPPDHRSAEDSAVGAGARSARPFTGTVPDYGGGGPGLRLKGVIPDGPAARAGLREDDVIIEFAGVAIHGAEDYAHALETVEIGKPVRLVFLRDGREHAVEIVPDARKRP